MMTCTATESSTTRKAHNHDAFFMTTPGDSHFVPLGFASGMHRKSDCHLYDSAHRSRRLHRSTQHTFHYTEVNVFGFRVADSAFAKRNAFDREQVSVRPHHVGTEDVQANEVLLAGEAHFHDAVA